MHYSGMNLCLVLFVHFMCVYLMYGKTCTTYYQVLEPISKGVRRLPVSKTLTPVGPNGCLDECMRRRDCVFINYNAAEYKCELGYDTKATQSTDSFFFYKDKKTVKTAPPSACTSKTCSSGEVCLVAYDNTTFCVNDN